MVDGRTPEQGYTISSLCEQESSCELIIGGRDPPKLIERTFGRNDHVRNDPDRNDPFTYARRSCQSSVKAKVKIVKKFAKMAKNKDQFSFSIFVSLIH